MGDGAVLAAGAGRFGEAPGNRREERVIETISADVVRIDREAGEIGLEVQDAVAEPGDPVAQHKFIRERRPSADDEAQQQRRRIGAGGRDLAFDGFERGQDITVDGMALPLVLGEAMARNFRRGARRGNAHGKGVARLVVAKTVRLRRARVPGLRAGLAHTVPVTEREVVEAGAQGTIGSDQNGCLGGTTETLNGAMRQSDPDRAGRAGARVHPLGRVMCDRPRAQRRRQQIDPVSERVQPGLMVEHDMRLVGDPREALPDAVGDGRIVVAGQKVPGDVGERVEPGRELAQHLVADHRTIEDVAGDEHGASTGFACQIADAIGDAEAGIAQQRRGFGIEATERFGEVPVARMDELKCHDTGSLARVVRRMMFFFCSCRQYPQENGTKQRLRTISTASKSAGGLPWRISFERVRDAPFPSARSPAPVTTDVETMIVGAGVVGLAIARALASAGQEVVVAERHDLIGSETSSRNSEVIHAGIYYPKGSLRARYCVAGKHQLYRFCDENGVDYARCEKLIVAANEAQLDRLDAIKAGAAANGVEDLRRLSAAEAMQLEPAVYCTGALLSPSTGLVDSHGFMLALEGHAEANGGQVALQTDITAIEARGDGTFALTIADTDTITARNVVISGGLHATQLARTISYAGNYRPPETYYAVGQYYALSGPSPFQRHIYPMPDGAWLGLHATVDLGNRCKFGPDIEWIAEIDYTFKPEKLDKFLDFIRMYYPGLDAERLHPDYTGIRPKLYREGEPVPDFRIDTPAEHGLDGLVMLFGIESPGLTAALAIGDAVAEVYARN